jgi:hypothetical protein
MTEERDIVMLAVQTIGFSVGLAVFFLGVPLALDSIFRFAWKRVTRGGRDGH